MHSKRARLALAAIAGGVLALPIAIGQAQTQPNSAPHFPVDQERQLFQAKCAGCHTIGGGRLRGPDLAQVHNFTQDAVRRQVIRMQRRAGPLTPTEIDMLVDYLTCAATAQPGAPTTAVPGTAAPVAPGMPPSAAPGGPQTMTQTAPRVAPGLMAQGPGQWDSPGAQLYSGRKPLANGGMACVVCHRVSGPGAAPSLMDIAHEKRGGRLVPFLQAPTNRPMRKAYAEHPITAQEAQALSDYFATIGSERHERRGMRGEHESEHEQEHETDRD